MPVKLSLIINGKLISISKLSVSTTPFIDKNGKSCLFNGFTNSVDIPFGVLMLNSFTNLLVKTNIFIFKSGEDAECVSQQLFRICIILLYFILYNI